MKPTQIDVDICFIGNYTRDSVVELRGTHQIDGGAFYYGASAAARTEDVRVGAITHLASTDLHVARLLASNGVAVRVLDTPQSTCLRLEYPTENPDERTIYVEARAKSFRPRDFAGLRTQTAVVGASFRGEVSLKALERLARHAGRLALDVQGFVRVIRRGRLAVESWPESQTVLSLVEVLKADVVEAGILTGSTDPQRAARMLQELGPREILLTHRDGLLVRADGQEHQAAFVPRRVLGRSGRGDTCLAAYASRRLSAGPAEAAAWAAALTSLKMESPGPFALDRRAVEELMARRY